MTYLLPAFVGTPEPNRVYNIDALALLRALPTVSINCIVTSPPYFGLRDYGIAGQIGLEPTPQAYVAALVELFHEARRVLRADSTLWLNLGDSYGSSGGDTYSGFNERYSGTGLGGGKQSRTSETFPITDKHTGLPEKSLLGIPWRVAFALQDDGWILRSDIIWAKGNPMPESVTDRPTKSHEYVFLFAKSPRYYYDAAAIAEPLSREYLPGGNHGGLARRASMKHAVIGNQSVGANIDLSLSTTRNKRDVWTVNPQPFAGSHFAVFPPALIEPMILAGCPVGGLVLDPFMGAGTTAVVAQKLGRNYIGSELNPEYCEMARRRIQQQTLPLPLFDTVVSQEAL